MGGCAALDRRSLGSEPRQRPEVFQFSLLADSLGGQLGVLGEQPWGDSDVRIKTHLVYSQLAWSSNHVSSQRLEVLADPPQLGTAGCKLGKNLLVFPDQPPINFVLFFFFRHMPLPNGKVPRIYSYYSFTGRCSNRCLGCCRLQGHAVAEGWR